MVGNIARITAAGAVAELAIPTHNSRPIAIGPEPGSNAMRFSEEAGNRIGRITPEGTVIEYPIPMTRPNVILAGLTFDRDRNLWLSQDIAQNGPTSANPSAAGSDYIVRGDKSLLTTAPANLSRIPITCYKALSCTASPRAPTATSDSQSWRQQSGRMGRWWPSRCSLHGTQLATWRTNVRPICMDTDDEDNHS